MFSVIYFLRSFFKTPELNEDTENKVEFNEDTSADQCTLEFGSFSQDQDEDYFETRSYFSDSPSELKSEVFESISDVDSISSDATDELNRRRDCILLDKEESVYSHFTKLQGGIYSHNTHFSKEIVRGQEDPTEASSCLQTQLPSPHKSLPSEHTVDKNKKGLSTSNVNLREDTENNNVTFNGLQHNVTVIEESPRGLVFSTEIRTNTKRGIGVHSQSEGCLTCSRSDTTIVASHQSLPNIHFRISNHNDAAIEYSKNGANQGELSTEERPFSNESHYLDTAFACTDHFNGDLMRTPSAKLALVDKSSLYQEDWGDSSHQQWEPTKELNGYEPSGNQHNNSHDNYSTDIGCGSSEPDKYKERENRFLVILNSTKANKSNYTTNPYLKPNVPEYNIEEAKNSTVVDNTTPNHVTEIESSRRKSDTTTDSSNKPNLIIISIQRTDAQATRNKPNDVHYIEEQSIQPSPCQSHNSPKTSQIFIGELSSDDLDKEASTNKDVLNVDSSDDTKENYSTESDIGMNDSDEMNTDYMVIGTSQVKQCPQMLIEVLDNPDPQRTYQEERNNLDPERNNMESANLYDLNDESNVKKISLSDSANMMDDDPSEDSTDSSGHEAFSFSDDDDEDDDYDSLQQLGGKKEDILSHTQDTKNIDMGVLDADNKSRSNICSESKDWEECTEVNDTNNEMEESTNVDLSDRSSGLPPILEVSPKRNKPAQSENYTNVDENNVEDKQSHSLQPPLISRQITNLSRDEQSSDLSDDDLYESSFLYNRSMRKASGSGRIDLDNFTRFRNNVSNVKMPEPAEPSYNQELPKSQVDSNDIKNSNKSPENKRLKERLSWAHKSFSSLFDFKNLEKENTAQNLESVSKDERKKIRPHQMSWRALRKNKERDSFKRLSVLTLSTHVISPNKPRKNSKEKIDPYCENQLSVVPDLLSSSPAEIKDGSCKEINCNHAVPTSPVPASEDVDIRNSVTCGATTCARNSFDQPLNCTTFNPNDLSYIRQSSSTPFANISNSDLHSMPCRPMSPKPQSQWPSNQRKSLRNSRASATSMTSLGNCSPLDGYLDSTDASMLFKPWMTNSSENETLKEDSGVSSQSQASIYTASSTSDILREDDTRPQNQTPSIKVQREKVLQKKKTSEFLVFTFPNTDTSKTSTLPMRTSVEHAKDSEKRNTKSLFRSLSSDDLWVNQRKQEMQLDKTESTIQGESHMNNRSQARTSRSGSAAPYDIFRIRPMKIHSFSQSTPSRLDLVGCVRRITFPVITDGSLDRPSLTDDMGSDEDLYDDLHVSSHRYGGGGEQLAINEVP